MKATVRIGEPDRRPIPPILICAVIFSVLIRFLEIYGFVTNTPLGLFSYWQGFTFGFLGLAELLFLCTLLILGVAMLEALVDRSNRLGWGTVVYCLMLVTYSGGIQFLSSKLIDGSF